MSERLANAPLVEVIFEMRWLLTQKAPNVHVDPHYSLLIGRLYDRIWEKNYPYHEKLPTSTMPEEMAGYVIQHRFRVEKEKWPLVQLGPGIITLNETEGYEWSDFERRLKKLIKAFLESYPDRSKLKISELSIRYLDAIPFNYSANPLEYLESTMGIVANVPADLFEDTDTGENPYAFNILLSFPQKSPEGTSFIRVGRGQKNGGDAILFETGVKSKGDNVPQELDEICSWINNSHELTSNWFKKLFKELMESFK